MARTGTQVLKLVTIVLCTVNIMTKQYVVSFNARQPYAYVVLYLLKNDK